MELLPQEEEALNALSASERVRQKRNRRFLRSIDREKPEQVRAREQKRPERQQRYFAYLSSQHPELMAILTVHGRLNNEDGDDWSNVVEHCLAEAVAGDILAQSLGLDKKSRARIMVALMLHDWYKRHEVEARRALGPVDGFALTSVEDEQKLRAMGVPEDIIKLAHANIPDRADPEYLKSRSIEEKVVHYLDMITDQSDLKPYQERVAKVLARPADKAWIESFRTKEGYDGMSLHEVQERALAIEEAEFAERLGIPKERMFDFVKGKFDRIALSLPERMKIRHERRRMKKVAGLS